MADICYANAYIIATLFIVFSGADYPEEKSQHPLDYYDRFSNGIRQ